MVKKHNACSPKAKIIATTALTLSPLIAAIIMGGTYVVNTFKGDILGFLEQKDFNDRYIVETQVDPEESLPDEELVTDGLADILEKDVPNLEEVEPDLEEEYSKISSELLEAGYEFKTIDFEALEEANSDVTAWIEIPGTNIEYPILQGDDNAYYLDHTIDGEVEMNGCIFADYRQPSLASDEQNLDDITIIYGHNYLNGKMFSELVNYQSEDFYQEHPYGVVYTPDGYAYKVEFFATVEIDGSDDSVLYRDNFQDEEEYNSYIEELKAKSKITSDVDLEFEDNIIAATTCSSIDYRKRVVVYGKLIKQMTKENQISSNAEKRYALHN